MIELTIGNIFDSDAEGLVNTVNCVGVMGRGIALQFKKAFPDNFKEYKIICEKQLLKPGTIFTHDTRSITGRQRYIFNFPTKRHWKGKSRLEDIQSGLIALVKEVQKTKIKSIAIPPLGCGLGGLPWDVVKNEITKAFLDLPDVAVQLYEPKGAPAAKNMTNNTPPPSMTKGRAALLELMRQYLRGLMDSSISLIELHKLMYFMQVSGENLQLKFVKGIYGPYAENLRHVLTVIEGHFVDGYGDGGDDPHKPLEYRAEASKAAQDYLKNNISTMNRVHTVAELIEGFESPYGMELLATVHWLVTQEEAKNIDEINTLIKEWSPRKAKIIQPRHVKIAYGVLSQKNWI